MEVLSEHLCQGWLEGYLLTGRHGVFNCYEAFIHIVDSMFNQHAKWLKVHRQLPWRRPVASLNYLLSSHVWQQDHNGFSHQDPGFIDHAVNKKAEVIRVYLPPDANTLLAVMEHCLAPATTSTSWSAASSPRRPGSDPAEAAHHCRRGLGIWEFAGSEVPGEEPDVVLACAGDVPTVETVAAAELLKEGAPGLKIRVVNVVDLMRLQDASEHPHGLTARDFDGIFTADKPYLRLPRLSRADPPAHLPARPTGRACMFAATRRKAPPRRPSTWPCSTESTASSWPSTRSTGCRGWPRGTRCCASRCRTSRMRARDHTREHGEDPKEISGWTLDLRVAAG